MSQYKSEFLKVLSERGFIHQISDAEGLDKLFSTSTVTAYVGYDCTAPSLHIGNLLSVMMLHWMQKTGHRPIVLVGGGTTLIGDPSFRDESRPLLDETAIESNKAGIRTAFAKFVDFNQSSTGALLVDNVDWLKKLNYVEFLRDVGRHFSVNRMLSMDSVKLRLDREHELTFLEFNYMILQAYDFVELARRYGCTLQMGGSDQWGNIVNGLDLGRRMGLPQLYALTCPLLTTSSGAKMGKTARGAVWLNADMLSPYEYWQYWRNSEDADVGRFLKLYTELPLEEIARLAALKDAGINEAKKVLANEATALLHGRAAAEEAARGENIPVRELDRGEGEERTQRRAKAIVLASGLVRSVREARDKINEGAVRINDEIVIDAERWYDLAKDVEPGTGAFRVQLGKTKKLALVKPKG